MRIRVPVLFAFVAALGCAAGDDNLVEDASVACTSGVHEVLTSEVLTTGNVDTVEVDVMRGLVLIVSAELYEAEPGTWEGQINLDAFAEDCVTAGELTFAFTATLDGDEVGSSQLP